MGSGSLRPVAAAFIVFGFFAGAWAVAAVDIEHSFHLSDAGLGFLLAGGIVAATAMAAVGGALSDRWGAGRAMTRALFVWGAFVLVEACSPTLGVFAPVFVIAISAGGLVDVVMNVIAADVLAPEPGKLVRFHGLFNGGAVLGAAAMGICDRLDGSWRIVWVAVGVVALLLGIVASRARLPEPETRTEHPSMWRALIGLRHEGLIVLALVFGAAAMVEGGVATWGVLYMCKNLGLGVLAGVSAYVVGQVLSTLSRIGGGGIVGALGTRRAIALGGAVAAVGLIAEAGTKDAAVAATGLALAAVGISVVWPLLIADVNNKARHPALAIGGVTASGYLGMVAGPPLVGSLSALFGLRTGLIVLAAIAFTVAATPSHVRARRDYSSSSGNTF